MRRTIRNLEQENKRLKKKLSLNPIRESNLCLEELQGSWISFPKDRKIVVEGSKVTIDEGSQANIKEYPDKFVLNGWILFKNSTEVKWERKANSGEIEIRLWARSP